MPVGVLLLNTLTGSIYIVDVKLGMVVSRAGGWGFYIMIDGEREDMPHVYKSAAMAKQAMRKLIANAKHSICPRPKRVC
jgi:hypothetical protein